jgi:hypothetical protein
VKKATYPLKLSSTIKREAARLAKQDGVSLDHWIALAVAHRIGAAESAREFFARRAKGGSVGELVAMLNKVPDAPPMPGDDIEGAAEISTSRPSRTGPRRRRPTARS